MLAQKLLSGGVEEKLYVDDVFSTYLYTGNNSTQTINNGIDLAGKGGLVWIKQRNGYTESAIFDSSRSLQGYLSTNLTSIAASISPTAVSLNNNGFSLPGGWTAFNGSGSTYASWTFRKAPKFFDVVTYTGNGAIGRILAHNLGIMPGFILIKRTDSESDWYIGNRHSDNSFGFGMALNKINAETSVWTNGNATATQFDVNIALNSSTDTNINGATYVAYLFAHDPSADGIIQCGSFTTDTNGNATVNLGWEPQYLMVKQTNVAGSWWMFDSMRGFTVSGNDARLFADSSVAETSTGNNYSPSSNGFDVQNLSASNTYIYLAIRRPNKPPTSGTQVFTSDVFTSSGTGNITRTIEFPPDFSIEKPRSNGGNWISGNRLTAWNKAALFTALSNAEADFSTMEGVVAQGANQNSYTFKQYYDATPYLNYMFRRAPGFFDVVCYTGGTGVQQHNLGVRPELIITKTRSVSSPWETRIRDSRFNDYWSYQNSNSFFGFSSDNKIDNWYHGYDSDFNEKTFNPGSVGGYSEYPGPMVAYLFSSLKGVSKVGLYSGNGSTKTINCGFTTGARFILIKRTDAAGDWYVWDSARGIIAANDPHLSLNTTAAEVTTDDSVDPDPSGFIVNQVAATNINVTSASYLFLAIA